MGSWRNSVDRYGRVAQSFHWIVAALVLTQVWIGITVDDLPLGIERLKWMARHKALGMTILFIVLLRLAWRWYDPAPRMQAGLPTLQRRLATTTHVTLYLLLIAGPIAGWLSASAAGFGVSWFGVFTFPDLIAKNPGLHETFETLHEVIVKSLATLICLHAAAAVIHGLRKDGIFTRMLPNILLSSNDQGARE